MASRKMVSASPLEDDVDDSPIGENLMEHHRQPAMKSQGSGLWGSIAAQAATVRNRRVSEWSAQMQQAQTPVLTLVASDVGGKACILEVASVKEFVRQPLPTGALLRCHLTREKSRGKYVLSSCDGEKYIIHAQKRGNEIPVLLNDELIGRVRRGKLGTDFAVLDGDSPTAEVCAVHYDATILKSSGTPRRMDILLPALSSSKRFEPHRPQVEHDQLWDRFKRHTHQESFVAVQNEPPKWNPKTQMHELKFRNRDLVPSVKNFRALITEEGGKPRCVLEFAKLREDKFVVEFMHPLSPLQAFTICVTSIVNKKALV
eukprot:TRINITY_DN18640_c0_g1::TRINITY_DN18640_c0_g1_i1::g.20380::m.20380 TRINITY_DN18640_c0_g1::TRINITY_DN18640_c0_g1_i1::g.20380  ORF type:complete len:316 (+),score=42.68,sp/Q9Z273/TULP1_MOUSE/32.43/1e-27,Tub/PF01167.13/69,Tub/PF01167.13/3.9e-26,DUF3527/PF12043.3/0.00012 TRINITY_DN18640_c0_g1_i1:88-1035(+)